MAKKKQAQPEQIGWIEGRDKLFGLVKGYLDHLNKDTASRRLADPNIANISEDDLLKQKHGKHLLLLRNKQRIVEFLLGLLELQGIDEHSTVEAKELAAAQAVKRFADIYRNGLPMDTPEEHRQAFKRDLQAVEERRGGHIGSTFWYLIDALLTSLGFKPSTYGITGVGFKKNVAKHLGRFGQFPRESREQEEMEEPLPDFNLQPPAAQNANEPPIARPEPVSPPALPLLINQSCR